MTGREDLRREVVPEGQVRYDVWARPCRRWGWQSKVSKTSGLGEGEEMRWEPEPTFWRPTEAGAVRRAERAAARLRAARAPRARRG